MMLKEQSYGGKRPDPVFLVLSLYIYYRRISPAYGPCLCGARDALAPPLRAIVLPFISGMQYVAALRRTPTYKRQPLNKLLTSSCE